jgi:hypothetical protein
MVDQYSCEFCFGGMLPCVNMGIKHELDPHRLCSIAVIALRHE